MQSGQIGFAQLALQSGSDRILDLMQRGYRVQEVLDVVGAIRRRCPSMVLRTQIMVGFPTETDDDFRESLAVIRTGLFDYADFFRYTSRPGTPAAALFPEVPFSVIMRRYRRLLIETLVKHPFRKHLAIRRLHAPPKRGT